MGDLPLTPTLSPPAGRGSHSLTGLFGGSFDPVHLGHVATAEELYRRFPFREIRFLPAARSPLKAGASVRTDRLALLQLALAGKQGLTVDESELRRPAPSYSIDTLREQRAELGPAASLVFILGMDSFLDLPRWKDWPHLTDYAHLLVVSRPGSQPVFSPVLSAWLEKHRITDAQSLESRPLGGVLLVETTPHAIASREIRAAIASGQDTSHWLNPAVRDYIEQHRLYSGDADPE
ncbi:MAG: nicotinate-nucleotide adenylyltransferase [bacterium]|nr:nicotinate-nucleotide adenylyltransferase [bacterium]